MVALADHQNPRRRHNVALSTLRKACSTTYVTGSPTRGVVFYTFKTFVILTILSHSSSLRETACVLIVSPVRFSDDTYLHTPLALFLLVYHQQ